MFGERLKLARKRAGMSLRELAQQLDGKVTAQALGKYERGEMMPGSTVLLALTKVLDLSLDYFTSPMQASLTGVEFRKHSGTRVKDRARVEAEVLQQVERYLMIEEILDLNSALWNDPLGERRRISALADCDPLADEVRERWALGHDPIPDLTQLLEQHGIKVLLLDLPARVDGLTCLVQRPGRPEVPCIVVNRNSNLERRRMTLAHELAHRLIDEDSPVDEEKAAMRFAGAFLMPADHLRAEVGSHRQALGYREIIQLKRLYRVSAAAIIVRLEQLEVISHSALVYAFQTYGHGWRKQEPEPLESGQRVFERPKRFERLCYRALAEGLISLPKAASLLQQPVTEIEAAVKGPGRDDASRHQRQLGVD